MSLPHALLTALVECPCSGSELAARFDRSIGYFWSATHQQIYRELARLEASGWIESLPEENTRGRKRAYKIVAAGRKELKRWVAESAEPAGLRDELMVRLWAEAAVGPTKIEAVIRRRVELHQDKLALYRSIDARDFPDGPPDRQAALHQLVLRSGIKYESYWIEILGDALEILAWPVGESDRPPGERR
jgi:DNA-binding PadR family transcriptional regulator